MLVLLSIFGALTTQKGLLLDPEDVLFSSVIESAEDILLTEDSYPPARASPKTDGRVSP